MKSAKSTNYTNIKFFLNIKNFKCRHFSITSIPSECGMSGTFITSKKVQNWKTFSAGGRVIYKNSVNKLKHALEHNR